MNYHTRSARLPLNPYEETKLLPVQFELACIDVISVTKIKNSQNRRGMQVAQIGQRLTREGSPL